MGTSFCSQSPSMADGSCKDDASAFSSPQLIFIRLGKEKSKDKVEDEIFKFITKVWEESNGKENLTEEGKKCITLSELDSRMIRQVAVGPEYVGLVLTDGRVCRFRCVTKALGVSSKVVNSRSSTDEPLLQLQGDEVLNTHLEEGGTDSSSSCAVRSPEPEGLPNASLHDSSLSSGSSRMVLSDVLAGTRTDQLPIGRYPPSNSTTKPSNSSDFQKEGQLVEKSYGSRSSIAKDSELVSKEIEINSEISKSTSASVFISETSDSNKSAANIELKSVEHVSSPSATRVSDSEVSNKKTENALQSRASQREDLSLENRYGQLSSGNSIGRSLSGSASRGLNTRKSVSSPTLIQRTVFTRNLPGISFFVPTVSSASFPGYLTCPSIPARLQPHIVRAQLAQAGAFPRGPTTSDFQRRNDRNVTQSKTVNCSDEKFCFPEVGCLEWLKVENGTEVAFSQITAMHSEFVLVEKGTGILYHWPYKNDMTNEVPMEIASAHDSGNVPLAKPHPLGEWLGLDSEEVHLLTSCNVRCSLVTTSGKLCTFYDKLLREANCGESPALIREMSHSATMFTELKTEKILSISCSEFFTSILTQSGKVYWWGLLPAEERQNLKQKLHKATSEAGTIVVDEKVQLRQHFPGFPGALVYKPCSIRGPLVGRLIGHESPEGNTTVVTKIKIELLNHNGTDDIKPSIGTTQMVGELPSSSVVNSPRSRIEEELCSVHRDTTRSFSPNTSVRSKAQISDNCSNGSEIWEVKDVVFLESENKVLGTVAAIDGPHVIVKVAGTLSSSESSLRVFKVSELESVAAVSEGLEGTALSQQLPTSSLYRGCIQHAPKCIVGGSKSANKDLLNGLKPVAMATTTVGISLLAQRSSDGKSFFVGPATEQGNDRSKVYTSNDVNAPNSCEDDSCTVEAEAIPSHEAALGPTSDNEKAFAGQKRRRSAAADSEVNAQTASSNNESISSAECSVLPCNFQPSRHKHPLLHPASGFDFILLTDVNGCLYPRPYGTKLSNPTIGQVAPVQSLGLGTRLCRSAGFDSSTERVLVVFLAFQEQRLLQAIQSGVLRKIRDALNWLEQLNNSKDTGKGSKGVIKGYKKMVISDNQGRIQEETIKQFVPTVSKLALCVLHQHLSSNQNILHVCCSNPPFAKDNKEGVIDSLLQDYGKGVPPSSNSGDPVQDIPVEVASLDMLLNHSVFAPEIVPMLKERDARGYTPFMTAIQCHNLKAAMYILEFVEKHKDNTSPKLKCSLEDMIFPETFNGVTPLHALAICCTENLPSSGLGNSLTVSNLPSTYTPRILLKLFQARYPSAYRAAIPPVTMEGRKYYCTKTPRQKMLDKLQKDKGKQLPVKPVPRRGTLAPPTPTTSTGRRYGEGGGRIPIVSSRRESLTGMVTFADPKELRQALVEMNHHMVSSEMTAPEGGLASLVQHVLHVHLNEVETEEAEKVEMEVGVRGGLYNVSNVEGVKIVPKSQTGATTTGSKMVSIEDKLICYLFRQLLSYPEIATGRNKEGETTLAFLVNNSRWIKQTIHQNLRLRVYEKQLFGQAVGSTVKQERVPAAKLRQPLQDSEVMAEIKITSTGDASMLESNLLAQLDDISSSFRSIVDTLTTLEKRCSIQQQQQQQEGVSDDIFKAASEVTPSPSSGNVVSSTPALKKPSVSASATESTPNLVLVPEELSYESLPVLIQLTQSWPSVAATILGHYPADTSSRCSDVHMSEKPNSSDDTTARRPSSSIVVESSTLDSFVHELLWYASEAVLVSIVETVTTEMNKHATHLTLDNVLDSNHFGNAPSARDLAFAVGLKFLRSVIRQLAVHLSRTGLSYVDLQSRIGSGSSATNTRRSQNDTVNFTRKVKLILRSFSWLSVHELIQAAEASVLPVREGVAKPQARSTGSSVSNGIPNPNGGFPGARFRNLRPGIRVTGANDTSGRSQDPLLRTAYRLNENRPTENKPLCRGVRLTNVTEGPTTSSTNKKPAFGISRGLPFELAPSGKKSFLLDSDSDSDDEMDQMATLIGEGADSDMEIEDSDQPSVSMATGMTHDHPYAWALDGRVTNMNELYNSAGNLYVPIVHLSTNAVSPRSVHTGNCYLTRMFSRLVKETLDLMCTLCQDTDTAKDDVTNDPLVTVLSISLEESQIIQSTVLSVLEKSWVWLAGVLDVVEGQLRMGKHFDTKRYLASLQRSEDTDPVAMVTRSMSSVPGATPEEYLMFLLRAHNNEHKDALPVMDMLCYEHTVYVLDAFMYSMTNWPRAARVLNRGISSVSSHDGEELGASSSQTFQTGAGPSDMETKPSPNTEAKRRHRHNHEREALVKFFGMDVIHADREKFLNSLHDSVQQKFPKVPKASWEVFTHNVTVARQKSVDDTRMASQREHEKDTWLPTTFSAMNRQTFTPPLVLNWSPDQVVDRWKICVDLFSRLFLADGPGAERDSFLAARAGVAGRLTRFRRSTSYLRDSIANESHQHGLGHTHYYGYGGLGGRLGVALTLSIKRQRILEDAFRILGEMTSFHYSNLRIKFEGEEGSGPGVNRGFFAAVANALKSDEKLPAETAPLLHEPGKLPEQSGFYAPKPFAYPDNSAEDTYLKKRRIKMYTAIGRFIGLSLWFSNTVPLNFSRHVVKFLLEREVTWEDLAFFNADLLEGLSRMILDGSHPLMTSERFQATYCCHFETSVGGSTEELIPGGSQIPVTPDNIYSYVRLYASKVMIGCVEAELRAVRSGLHDIIPPELLSSLTPEDFQLLLSGGTTDVDINRLRSVITFSNSNGCSSDILEKFKKWFWSIVQKMTPLQRQQLLYFCTGSAVLPAMSDRRDPDQDLNITVDVVSGNTKLLPMATTCGQRMSIPLYSSKKILKRKLLQAIQCQSYGMG